MPDLFVANCTRQPQIVCFRLDFNKEGQRHAFKVPEQRTIPPGQQLAVAKDEHIDAITAIEEQLRVYGMIAVEEISRTHDATYVPLIFSAGNPVRSNAIRAVMDHNNLVRRLQGKDRRMKAAVASNDLVNNTVERELESQQMPPESMPRLKDFTVDLEQTDTTEDHQVRLEEGVHVAADGETALAPPQVRRKPGPKPGSTRKKD